MAESRSITGSAEAVGVISGTVSGKQKVSAGISGKQKIMARADRATPIQSYNTLKDKPSIEDVELIGNRKLTEFGVHALTNKEIEELLK